MDWSKIGKFLVDNQDDIKKMAENTAKAVRCANNLHEQHKKRKAEKDAEQAKVSEVFHEIIRQKGVSVVNMGIFDSDSK